MGFMRKRNEQAKHRFLCVTENISATKLECEKFWESKSIGRVGKRRRPKTRSGKRDKYRELRDDPTDGRQLRKSKGGRERDTSKDVPIQMSWTFKIFRMLNRPRPDISISLLRLFSRQACWSIAVGDAHEIPN